MTKSSLLLKINHLHTVLITKYGSAYNPQRTSKDAIELQDYIDQLMWAYTQGKNHA